jgi:hypothetical protein
VIFEGFWKGSIWHYLFEKIDSYGVPPIGAVVEVAGAGFEDFVFPGGIPELQELFRGLVRLTGIEGVFSTRLYYNAGQNPL